VQRGQPVELDDAPREPDRQLVAQEARDRQEGGRRLARVASAQPEVLLARLAQTSQRHARLRLRRQGFE